MSPIRPMTEDPFITYVIYDHPSDYPDSYPVRRFEWATPKDLIGVGKTLEEARALLPVGLYKMPRRFTIDDQPDDPCIAEVWI